MGEDDAKPVKAIQTRRKRTDRMTGVLASLT